MKPLPSFTFRFLLCLLLLVAPAGARAEGDGWVRILLLGDSTTQGSVPRRLQPEGPHLEQVVRHLLHADPELPRCKVYNSGVGGETIHRLLESGRYEREVAGLESLDIVFIRYGLNDQARRENFADNFPKDYRALLARLREDHPEALLIPTTVIPYFDEEASREINDFVRQVAEEEGLALFDLYPPLRRRAGERAEPPQLRGIIEAERPAWVVTVRLAVVFYVCKLASIGSHPSDQRDRNILLDRVQLSSLLIQVRLVLEDRERPPIILVVEGMRPVMGFNCSSARQRLPRRS